MPRSLALLVVSLLLVAACSAGAPATPSAAPPTNSGTQAPTIAPTPAPTTAPTAAPSAAGSPYCDPEMGYGNYGCEPGEGTPPPVTGDIVVGLSENGNFLVGPTGMSLYTFDNDAPETSNCEEDCLDNWPPLGAEEGQAAVGGDGVTGELTTFHRSDGSHQVAYDGQPLYYYFGDTIPGDAHGDGVGDVWHLATP